MEKEHSKNLASNMQVLKDRVALDLERKLQEYRDPRVGTRLLAKKMEINERTLKRLLQRENRPTYQTLLKIYGVIHQTTNPAQIVELVPDIVKNEILKHFPEVTELKAAPMQEIETELLYDRCFSDLYVMAGCGPLSLEFVQYRYGIHGVETLEKMVELRALKRTDEGQYIIGDNQVNLSAETLKRIGLNIVEKFSKPQNTELGGDNLIAFYAEGLSEEAYDDWLKVDERAFREKIKISQKPGAKGNKKVFTYMVTDTLKDK